MEFYSSTLDRDLSVGFDDSLFQGLSAGSYSAGSGISHTPPRFTPGSYEISHMKRARGGSISGRLRSASDLEERGVIDKSQKNILKDLIISGDEALQKALDYYESGDSSRLIALMQRGILNRRDSLDLLRDLDVGLLSVDLDGFNCPDLQMLDDNESSAVANMFLFDHQRDDNFTNFPRNHSLSEAGLIAGSFSSDCSFTSAIFLSGNMALSAPTEDSHFCLDNLENMSFNVTFEDDFGLRSGQMLVEHQESVSENGLVLSDGSERHLGEDLELTTAHIEQHSSEGDHIIDSSTIGPLPVHSPSHASNDPEVDSNIDYKDNYTAEESGFSPQFHFSFTDDLSLDLHGDISSLGVGLGLSGKNTTGRMLDVSLGIDDNIIGMNTISMMSNSLSCSKMENDDGSDEKRLVGAYSPDSRLKRIERFHEKRKHRVWTKTVKYDVRKNFADTRMRVKGRFVKKDDEALLREVMALC